MKSAGLQCSTNPDTFAKLDPTQATDLLTEIKVDPVRYMVWKKVQIEVNNKKKEKMKIVNVSAAKEEFIKVVKEEIMEFKDHVGRVKNQYNQVKRLKEILPNNKCIGSNGLCRGLQMSIPGRNSIHVLEHHSSCHTSSRSLLQR